MGQSKEAASNPFFAGVTPHSANPFQSFRSEGIIGGGLAGQPKAVVPSSNPFFTAVTPITSTNPFRSSLTGQPSATSFPFNGGIRPESSAITAPPTFASNSTKSISTIGGCGSCFPQNGTSAGVPGKSEGGFISPPTSNNSSPVFPYSTNWNNTQPFQHGGQYLSSSTSAKAASIEIGSPKHSFVNPQLPFQYPTVTMTTGRIPWYNRGSTIPVPVSVPVPAPAPIAAINPANLGVNTIVIASNSPAGCGAVQPQQKVLVESTSQGVSQKIDFLMKQYEELISTFQDTSCYSKPAEEASKEEVVDSGVVDASTTFRGFSGGNVHYRPDSFTHRACTARVVPRGIRASSDSRPLSAPVPSRTVKPLNNYTLVSLSSPDLLCLVGRNAKKMVIPPQATIRDAVVCN